MAYDKTTALSKILKMNKRLRIVQGGARAGKTIAILLILIDMAQTRQGKTISIVSATFPHLKRGAMRDFLDIMKSQGYYKDSQWNRTDSIYTFESGSIIEFFSADQADKVRGPARNILFINEANNINYETYTQLAIRTSDFIYLDYNPVAEFWAHEEIMTGNEDIFDFDIITYKDNEHLADEIVKEIESRKSNKNFWKVFGLGQIGEAEGKIYKGWQLDVDLPHEARLERRGLDFGYAHDPASLVDIYSYNGGYILDELVHRVGMNNRQLADVILNQDDPNVLTIGDSAEPKSIDEMREYGVNIIGANKGPGSRNQGIQWVQSQRISVTKRSHNIAKAYKNYMWMTDKDGNITTEPDHYLSDAMDAVRYGLETFRPRKEEPATHRQAAINTLTY